MVYLLALMIFVGLSTACWFVSISLTQSTLGHTTPGELFQSRTTAILAIGIATLTCFLPFPAGYLAGLVVWAVATFGGLGIGATRAGVLFGYLAMTSFLARLIVLGVMAMVGS